MNLTFDDFGIWIKVWVNKPFTATNLYKFPTDEFYTDITDGCSFLEKDILDFVIKNKEYDVCDQQGESIIDKAIWPEMIIIKKK